ncbi:hypothetical protein KAR91_44425 [Candidatus Pacearchaeota archaeon]|nr:hypothetical protein [Candidatus Pacearchaeota archaeon]
MATIKIEREGDCLCFDIGNDKAKGLIVELVNEKYNGDEPKGIPSQDDNIKEPPQEPEPLEEEPKEPEAKGPLEDALTSMHTGGKKANPAREKALKLLEAGNTPKEVFDILKKKYPDHPTLNLVHQWNSKRKKAALANKAALPKAIEPEPTTDEYSHLIPSQKRDIDLIIIKKLVMCPVKGKAVNIAICQTGCLDYRTMVKHHDDDEPYVRCSKAKIEL